MTVWWPQSVRPSTLTGRECISICLSLERRHLFIVRISDGSSSLSGIFLQEYVSFIITAPAGRQKATWSGERSETERLSPGLNSTAVPVMSHDTRLGGFCIFYDFRQRRLTRWPLTWKVNCQQPVGLWLKETVRWVCMGRSKTSPLKVLIHHFISTNWVFSPAAITAKE